MKKRVYDTERSIRKWLGIDPADTTIKGDNQMSNALDNRSDKQLAAAAKSLGEKAHKAALCDENPACYVTQLANLVAEYISSKDKAEK